MTAICMFTPAQLPVAATRCVGCIGIPYHFSSFSSGSQDGRSFGSQGVLDFSGGPPFVLLVDSREFANGC